ncbi:MAG: hypothetical protein SF029_07950 [bacterium]|nr:hypothetical protein [bacterium]
MKVLRWLLICLVLTITLTAPLNAQTSYTLIDFTPLLEGASGTSLSIALSPQDQPVIAWREQGATFGADRLNIRLFDGATWNAVDTTALLDPTTSQISENGVAVSFDSQGRLIAAVNRVVSELGFDQLRTVVARYDGATWTQIGEFAGEGQSISPIYLLNVAESVALAWLTPNALHIQRWNGEAWEPLLNGMTITEGVLYEGLYAASVGDNHALAWTKVLPTGERNLNFYVWDPSGWRTVPPLPNQNDFQIGLAELVGIAPMVGGGVYVAASETGGTASDYVTAYQLPPDSSWNEAGLPEQAAESDCARNHTIATAPDGSLYYAWTADCRGVLPVTRWISGQGWETLGEPIEIGSVGNDQRQVSLRIAGNGTVFLGWLEATNGQNQTIRLAALVPNN